MLIKVYDTINWLSKNLRTHVWYNENESRSDIETWSIDRVVNTRVYTRNSFETKIFWKRIITKPCEKLTWFFLLHLVPCYGQDCGKQKHVELVTSLSLHCQEQFIFEWTITVIFDDLIQSGFRALPKFYLLNYVSRFSTS